MPTKADQLSIKVVICCHSFKESRRFYSEILDLPVLEEWEEKGGQGCIFGFETGGSVEIYQMFPTDKRYDASFDRSFQDDKIDLQLRTGTLDAWIERVKGHWPFNGPKTLPWGQRWIQLRDPDNLLVAIYEERID